MNETLLFGIAGLLALLWYVSRSARPAMGDKVQATVYCLHCNWEGRTAAVNRRCGRCGSQHVSVLSV